MTSAVFTARPPPAESPSSPPPFRPNAAAPTAAATTAAATASTTRFLPRPGPPSAASACSARGLPSGSPPPPRRARLLPATERLHLALALDPVRRGGAGPVRVGVVPARPVRERVDLQVLVVHAR